MHASITPDRVPLFRQRQRRVRRTVRSIDYYKVYKVADNGCKVTLESNLEQEQMKITSPAAFGIYFTNPLLVTSQSGHVRWTLQHLSDLEILDNRWPGCRTNDDAPGFNGKYLDAGSGAVRTTHLERLSLCSRSRVGGNVMDNIPYHGFGLLFRQPSTPFLLALRELSLINVGLDYKPFH